MINNFGEFLYTLRKEKGWTQSELADKLGITNKAVSKWETGDAFPETAQLVPLSTVFNISVDELLRGARNGNIEHEKTVEEEPATLKPFTKKQSVAIACAIGLMLVGVMILISLALNNTSYGIFVSQLLVCVSIAVFVLVMTGLTRALDSTEMSAEVYAKGKKISIMLALGIGITILSVIPILALSAAGVSESVFLPIFFAILIIGVPIIVFSGIQWGNLTKAYNIPNDEGAPLKGKAKSTEDAICGVIMMSATAVFLLLGFLRNMWHIAWVVFPIGGILCGIASTIIRGVVNNQQK